MAWSASSRSAMSCGPSSTRSSSRSRRSKATSAAAADAAGRPKYTGPGPCRALRSPGLDNWQRSSDRQPQLMQPVRPAFSRSSSAMRASMRRLQLPDSFAQSSACGTRVPRQLLQRHAHFIERQTHALGKHDEGDATDHRAQIAPVARWRAHRLDEIQRLVEAQGRGRPRRCAPPAVRWSARRSSVHCPASRLDFK